MNTKHPQDPQAAAEQLKFERDEYKRLAESWMADYDKLKEKYEPLIAIQSSANIPESVRLKIIRESPEVLKLVEVLEAIAEDLGEYPEQSHVEIVQTRAAQRALTAHKKSVEEK